MSAYVKINQDDINRLNRDFLLMNGEIPLAQSRVINRALSAVNTEGSVQVRKVYGLKASRIKKNFKIRKATKNNLNANWQSKGEPVGLVNFGARQNKRGVSVKVEVADSRKTIDHTFIQVGRNNTEHVFWREKKGGVMVGRYNMNRLTGPRVEDALERPEAQKALQKTTDDTIQKRLEVEADYILSKARR